MQYLADEGRRKLLDELHKSNGQTLTQLCAHLDMSRQAVAKRLALREDANLIATAWHGREKLHYLNPMPLHEICERRIGKYERHRLQALSALKKGLEKGKIRMTAMEKPEFINAAYIRTTLEKSREALTGGDFSEKYWFDFRFEAELKAGGNVRIIPPGNSEKWARFWFASRSESSFIPGQNDKPDAAAKRDGLSRVT